MNDGRKTTEDNAIRSSVESVVHHSSFLMKSGSPSDGSQIPIFSALPPCAPPCLVTVPHPPRVGDGQGEQGGRHGPGQGLLSGEARWDGRRIGMFGERPWFFGPVLR